jgi:hypothetical protein
MDERQDQDQPKDQDSKAEPDAANAAANGDLPEVEAPKLAAGEDEADAADNGANADGSRALPALWSDSAGETEEDAGEPTAERGPKPRSYRFAMLAATIAFAAGFGSFVGALTSAGVRHAAPTTATVAIPRVADTHDVATALKTQLAELAALKSSLDSANRSAGVQLAKIGERLDALERAEADPAAKLAHIAADVDRLAKQNGGSPDITGSVAANPPPAAPPVSAPATVPASAPEAALAGPVLHNWQVEEVHDGRALVASRSGSEFLVGSGSSLPGLGHVQDIKRQNGKWIVITEKGLITSW